MKMKENLDNVVALSLDQAMFRYGIRRNTLYMIADKAGASIRVTPRKKLYSREKLDAYFKKFENE